MNVIPFFNSYLKSLPFNSVCKKKNKNDYLFKILCRTTANKLFFKDGPECRIKNYKQGQYVRLLKALLINAFSLKPNMATFGG